MRGRGRSGKGHTHTRHRGAGRERASLVRPVVPPAASTGHPRARSLDPLAALGHVRCGPQHCASRRQPGVAWDEALLPHLQCHCLSPFAS